MRVLMAMLLASVALGGTALPALAQGATVEQAALTRVIIAPPRSELARIIKALKK